MARAVDTNVLLRVVLNDDDVGQAERARDAGCGRLVTFDRKLLREDGFVAP